MKKITFLALDPSGEIAATGSTRKEAKEAALKQGFRRIKIRIPKGGKKK